MLSEVEAIVVVGAKNSNDTIELAEQCRAAGRATFHIQSAHGLDPLAFGTFSSVGLTAGIPTPEEIIDEVHLQLLVIASRQYFINQGVC